MMESKKCTRCGLTLTIKEFSVSGWTKDGYAYRCKKCTKIIAKENQNKAKKTISKKKKLGESKMKLFVRFEKPG